MDIAEAVNFDSSIDAALVRMAEMGETEFGMTEKPRISMMAIVCQLEMESNGPNTLDLGVVRSLCANRVRYTKTTKRCLKNGYRSFYNSVTLMFGTKAVKVFSNGKLHITGCKTVACAHACVKSFLKMMLVDEPDAELVADSIGFSTKILNINCCVKPRKPGSAICLEKLQQKLQSLSATEAGDDEKARISSTRYNPDIYQALVAKMRCSADALKDVSALIFYTGTVILTGARQASDLERSFQLVCGEMKGNDIEM